MAEVPVLVDKRYRLRFVGPPPLVGDGLRLHDEGVTPHNSPPLLLSEHLLR